MPTIRRTVAVIPCGAAKAPGPARAAELYTSDHFRLALAAAVDSGADEVLVLSARHGLLHLDDVVAPYDTKMGDADAIGSGNLLESDAFAELVWSDADVYAPSFPGPTSRCLTRRCARRGWFLRPMRSRRPEGSGSIGASWHRCAARHDRVSETSLQPPPGGA